MSWRDDLPAVRGRLLRDEPLAPFTWLRVGGAADLLFLPADEDDLAVLLRGLPPAIPVTVLGVGSNVIVRDAGVEGVVIRLAGRAFTEIALEPEESRVIAGAAALDSAVARAAAAAGIGGLEFYAGIPGTIGGALTMNAGCYGGETGDWLEVAWGVDRTGAKRVFTRADFAFGYRSSRAPADLIWTGTIYRGRPGDRQTIEAAMTGSHERAMSALLANPLGPSAATVEQVWRDVLATNQPWLPQFAAY